MNRKKLAKVTVSCLLVALAFQAVLFASAAGDEGAPGKNGCPPPEKKPVIRQSATDSIGADEGEMEWFFAEGSTGIDARGNFETWILVLNPGQERANVDVTYFTPGGLVHGPHLLLGPSTRQSVNVADTLPNAWNVSTKVASDREIIAERAVYWNSSDGTRRQSATDSIGADEGETEWYFAEGSTGIEAQGNFETWILILNPGPGRANVDVTYFTSRGPVAGPHLLLEPFSRQSVNVADTLPNEWNVSAKVASDCEVVAERAVYWNTR